MSYKDLITKARLTTNIVVADEVFSFVRESPRQILKELTRIFYNNLVNKINDKVEVTVTQNEIQCMREYRMTTYFFTLKEIEELLEAYLEEKITVIEAEKVEIKLIEHKP